MFKDYEDNMYLKVDSLIEISSKTKGLNNLILRKDNVR